MLISKQNSNIQKDEESLREIRQVSSAHRWRGVPAPS